MTLATVFFALAIGRWLAHGWATRATARPKAEAEDLLSALMGVAYVVLATLSIIVGRVDAIAVCLLVTATVIRSWAVLCLREKFGYSFIPRRNFQLVAHGIYRHHRNPLLLGYWLELSAFQWTVPVPIAARAMLIVCYGILCGWHAHADNNHLALASSAYADYMKRAGNAGLNLFFPETARLFDTDRAGFDRFAVYVFAGCVAGLLFAMAHGLLPALCAAGILAGLAGATGFWRLTTSQRQFSIGFSFFGAFGGTSAVVVAYMLYTGAFSMTLLNVSVAAVTIGHGIGRIGCLAHGCCSGTRRESYAPYCVTYRDPGQKVNLIFGVRESVTTPSVVVEAMGICLISSACITWLDHAAAIWCIGYGTLRCIVQSTRMKAGSDGLLSSIAMGLLAAGIVLAVKVPGDGGHAGNTGQDVGVSLQASYLVVAVAVSLIVAASMGLRMRSGAAAT